MGKGVKEREGCRFKFRLSSAVATLEGCMPRRLVHNASAAGTDGLQDLRIHDKRGFSTVILL